MGLLTGGVLVFNGLLVEVNGSKLVYSRDMSRKFSGHVTGVSATIRDI